MSRRILLVAVALGVGLLLLLSWLQPTPAYTGQRFENLAAKWQRDNAVLVIERNGQADLLYEYNRRTDGSVVASLSARFWLDPLSFVVNTDGISEVGILSCEPGWSISNPRDDHLADGLGSRSRQVCPQRLRYDPAVQRLEIIEPQNSVLAGAAVYCDLKRTEQLDWSPCGLPKR